MSKRLILRLLLLTLAIRGGVILLAPEALSTDPDGYRSLAENLLAHGTFGHQDTPTAYRPPLYPLVLVPCVAMGPWSTAAIGVLHVLLGLASVWLVFRLAERCGLGRFALVAAVLVACDPILLGQSAEVMTETTATLLVLLTLVSLGWNAERPGAWRAAVAGGTSALAALCRPEFLLWMALGPLLLTASVRSRWLRWKLLGAFAAAAALVLMPWIVRNQIRFGRPIVATTHGGYTLLLGNNPHFYEYLSTGEWGSVWDAGELGPRWQRDPSRITPAEELQADRRAHQEARANIRHRPGMFLYSSLVRVGRLWSLAPHRLTPTARYVVGAWYLVELMLAVVGIWAVWGGKIGREAARMVFWGLVLAGCVTAVHTVYWSNMRMRAPLMPVVALTAAVGLAWLETRIRARK